MDPRLKAIIAGIKATEAEMHAAHRQQMAAQIHLQNMLVFQAKGRRYATPENVAAARLDHEEATRAVENLTIRLRAQHQEKNLLLAILEDEEAAAA